MNEKHVRLIAINDTTLRDGEQSPGAAMTVEKKVKMAGRIAALGVNTLEAGFPAASAGDFQAVQAIAREVDGPVISAMAHCHPRDIEQTAKALEPTPRRRIHLVLATSPIHREHKLKLSRKQIVTLAVESICEARACFPQVQLSCEDASGTEPEFLDEIIDAAIEAGATVLCLPDTLGRAGPDSYAEMFRSAAHRLPANGSIGLAAHCHNDLGLAVANSLAACIAGATQVECTVMGIGERAGNTALEEFVMALAKLERYDLASRIRNEKLYETGRALSAITGLSVSRNKPILGDNVFTTAAGIHQDGLIKDRATYEFINPEEVGAPRREFIITKHSGRRGLHDRLAKLGLTLTEEQFAEFHRDFLTLADTRREVSDGELRVLAARHAGREQAAPWSLVSIHLSTGTGARPVVNVVARRPDGREVQDAAVGDSSITGVIAALTRIVDRPSLELVNVSCVNSPSGEEPAVEVALELRPSGSSRTFRGRGAAVDIAEASAHAFLDAYNAIEGALPSDQ